MMNTNDRSLTKVFHKPKSEPMKTIALRIPMDLHTRAVLRAIRDGYPPTQGGTKGGFSQWVRNLIMKELDHGESRQEEDCSKQDQNQDEEKQEG